MAVNCYIELVADARWILLVHQLPPTPMYLRAKVRNRLERAGAVALKNSVYLLPRTPECVEDFEWIAQEAVSGGGEAWVLEADLTFGLDSSDLEERFRRARGADFEALTKEVGAVNKEASRRRGKASRSTDLAARLERLQTRFGELSRVDFFQCPERHGTEVALESLRDRIRSIGGGAPSSAGPTTRAELEGRTWVTRTGVHVDRIASAWLIRRFVDPKATFRFVPPGTKEFATGEVRFDMVGGEFTHEGDLCTFEMLAGRLGLRDAAVGAIAEIVHDIDLKDGKFGRADTPGVQQLITGIVLTSPDDEGRLEKGFALFDALHRSLAATESPDPAGKQRRGKPRRKR